MLERMADLDLDYLPADFPDINDSEHSVKRYVKQLLTLIADKGGSGKDIVTSSVEMDTDGKITYKTRSGISESSTLTKPIISYEDFQKRIRAADAAGAGRKVFLYLIDLQKDFVDGGAFAVYGGRAMVNEKLMPFITELQNIFKDRLYIRITRDFHPGLHSNDLSVEPLTKGGLESFTHLIHKGETRGEGWLGHCSFYKESDDAKLDAFPRHCEQGSPGTLLLDVLSSNETLTDPLYHPLVMVKGIFPNHDCFAGFPYQSQEDFTKSQLYACTHEHTTGEPEGYKKTGGYVINGVSMNNMIMFNETSEYKDGKPTLFDSGEAVWVSEAEHLPDIADGDMVIVCGLAGDFCVLNTASNIKKYLKSKGVAATVFVPQHLTRYPLLPFIAAMKPGEPLTGALLEVMGLKPKLTIPIDGNPVGTSIKSRENPDGTITYTVSDTGKDISIAKPEMDLGFYVTGDPSRVLGEYDSETMLLVDYPKSEEPGGLEGTSRNKRKHYTKKQRKNKRTRRQSRRYNKKTRRY